MQIWDITIDAPTGPVTATLSLTETGGEMTGKGGAGPMLDLQRSDTTLSWSTKIQRPMPMTLTFNGTIADGVLSGRVKFGLFAKGTFSGTQRAATAATTPA